MEAICASVFLIIFLIGSMVERLKGNKQPPVMWRNEDEMIEDIVMLDMIDGEWADDGETPEEPLDG